MENVTSFLRQTELMAEAIIKDKCPLIDSCGVPVVSALSGEDLEDKSLHSISYTFDCIEGCPLMNHGANNLLGEILEAAGQLAMQYEEIPGYTEMTAK